MSQALMMQLSLPAPAKVGAGGYKPWVEATKAPPINPLWHKEYDSLGERIELEVIVNPATGLDSVPFLAWVERILHEAGLLSKTNVLTCAGIYLDRKSEIPKDRVRVRLWSA